MARHIKLFFTTLVSTGFIAGHLKSYDNKSPSPASATGDDVSLVERVIAARKEYQKAMVAVYEHYRSIGDRERAKWAEEEIRAFHLMPKPSYRLDILDVPPPNLEAKVNVKEANDLFKLAVDYKDRGFGTEYILNQKRAEIVLQEILQKYPNCDKIADVAYMLGELYEGRAFKQYDRAAAYFERSFQWRKGSITDARIRAARLYDRQLSERSKAIELYREVIAHDTDKDRIKEAERRLAELTSTRR
jgi:tetratricopeptide (TPR) repeat protein